MKKLLPSSSFHSRCRCIMMRVVPRSDVAVVRASTAALPVSRNLRHQITRIQPFDACSKRQFSNAQQQHQQQYDSNAIDEERPTGTLFQLTKAVPIGPELVGATGMIQRTFGPRSNAEGLLATGGPDLAAHASFDPDYNRAQYWIRHHAVGPAVLSPILISGLTGALTEAAFPHGVITYQSMKHLRPLIVGVPVASMIEVLSVTKAERIKANKNDDSQHHDNDNQDHHRTTSAENNTDHKRTHGYDVTLRTVVSRVRDDCIIAEGTHELWVPDYLHM